MPYPFDPFKIDSAFDQQVSYGRHEGLDLNGLGGGNTDCNTPLKSISAGKCVHISQSTKDYGNLAVIEVTWNGVTYYIRYCHLNVISVRQGDVVKVGDQIGTMGSSGNSTHCHLHLDILKKKPSQWRFYTQSVTDWFVDPKWFILNYKEATMPETIPVEKAKFEELVGKSTKYDDFVKIGFKEITDIKELQLKAERLERENGELRKQLEEKPITPPDSDVKYKINGKTETFTTKEGVEVTINYTIDQ